ncbi:MAG: polysaccharide deacetylase [Clostridia bacterium]|nr:polysaccharide deacetylase [Clostridia bacterium]
MVVYEIESFEKKKSKKWIFWTILIVIIVIGIAIFGGIKTAEYVANQKVQKIAKEDKKEEDNQQNKDTNNSNNEQKNNQKGLTKEQLKAIDNIYDSKEKVAFLTFDDGPSSNITPQILDVLKKEDVKATFFVLGTMVKANPEVLKREKEEGHYIANHSYSHVYPKVYANENKPLEEYNKTNKIIQDALGDNEYQSNIFRFPGGSVGGYYDKLKKKAKKKFKENGISSLDWNCLTNDSDGANTKQAIMKNLKNTSKGKKSLVILMHDAPNKDLTAETLPDVIKYLREQGYSFKNMYDVIE